MKISRKFINFAVKKRHTCQDIVWIHGKKRSEFISNLKKLGGIESVSGVMYRIDTVNDKFVIGTRLSTLKEFKIETDGLYKAYNDVLTGKIPMTTTVLRDYVNRTQSPAFAIIMSLRKL